MEKKIIVKITPAAVLLAVLVFLAALFLTRGDHRDKQALTIQDTPVIITKIRSLGELTTACYYDEMVLSRTKPNALSSTALGSLAEGLGKDVDDHLVLIAKGTVRAGVDLMDMTEEDVRFVGDTAFIRLPAPQYLDVIVNPSDFEVFAETGKWTHDTRRSNEPAVHGPAAAPDGRGPLWPEVQGLCRRHGCRDRPSRRLGLHLHPLRPPRLLHPHAPACRVNLPFPGSGHRQKNLFRIFV